VRTLKVTTRQTSRAGSWSRNYLHLKLKRKRVDVRWGFKS